MERQDPPHALNWRRKERMKYPELPSYDVYTSTLYNTIFTHPIAVSADMFERPHRCEWCRSQYHDSTTTPALVTIAGGPR